MKRLITAILLISTLAFGADESGFIKSVELVDHNKNSTVVTVDEYKEKIVVTQTSSDGEMLFLKVIPIETLEYYQVKGMDWTILASGVGLSTFLLIKLIKTISPLYIDYRKQFPLWSHINQEPKFIQAFRMRPEMMAKRMDKVEFFAKQAYKDHVKYVVLLSTLGIGVSSGLTWLFSGHKLVKNQRLDKALKLFVFIRKSAVLTDTLKIDSTDDFISLVKQI